MVQPVRERDSSKFATVFALVEGATQGWNQDS